MKYLLLIHTHCRQEGNSNGTREREDKEGRIQDGERKRRARKRVIGRKGRGYRNRKGENQERVSGRREVEGVFTHMNTVSGCMLALNSPAQVTRHADPTLLLLLRFMVLWIHQSLMRHISTFHRA